MHLEPDTIATLVAVGAALVGGAFGVIKFIREPLSRRMDGLEKLAEDRRRGERKIFERLGEIDIKQAECLTALAFIREAQKGK